MRLSKLIIKIKRLHPEATIPTAGHADDACFDLSALEHVTFQPGEIKLVRTGLALEIPPGHRVNVYVRSSTPIKKGLVLANGVGVIDYGYRGELYIQLMNVATKVIKPRYEEDETYGVLMPNALQKGDRVGQMELIVSIPTRDIIIQVVDDLATSGRGTGGIGSTG
jgi:dUTP pyrophosphatase